MRTLLLLLLALLISACTAGQDTDLDRALAADQPPTDFRLGITVIAPAREPIPGRPASAAYADLPRAQRPARYIIEADRILRVALGPGATEQTFPPQTRRLGEDQIRSVWRALRDSSLTAPDHPALVGRGPDPSRVTDGTVYVITFTLAGDTRTLAIHAGGGRDEAGSAADARRLVDQLCDLAWITQ